jgi:hypothetical protein
MLKGLDAYEKNRDQAPQSTLRFKLVSANNTPPPQDPGLRIVTDQRSLPVPVADDGSFILPRDEQAAAGNADLLTNTKKGSYRWRPEVRSANVPAGMRRLGDLRVECAVRWAVEYEDVAFVTRNMFRMAGGPCHSNLISVMFPASQPLSRVQMVSGERRADVKLAANGKSYVPPLYDAKWNDDTLLEFTPAGQHPEQNMMPASTSR